jgi:Kef-type K+ transport system membrane component KefB
MGRAHSLEGRIILGAAICDDILGLIILAIVSGFVVSGAVVPAELVSIILLSVAFLIAAFALGPATVRWLAAIMNRLDIVEAKMFTSYLFVMVLAWLANLAGLATIIGAFAAGIILHDGYFNGHRDADKEYVISIRQLIEPLEVILVPIFFILMGIQVKIETFLSWPVLTLAGGLLLAAFVGKILSGIGAKEPANKWAVGFGMLPRGEVGLVFAAIGRSLNVIDDSIFAAIVLMVLAGGGARPSFAALLWAQVDELWGRCNTKSSPAYLLAALTSTNEKRVPLALDESRLKSEPMARRSRRAMESPIPLPEK